MHTCRGIGVETWVYLETDCEVDTEVERTQARFEFGHTTSSLSLCVSAGMLEQFATAATKAWRDWQNRFGKAATHQPGTALAESDALTGTTHAEITVDPSRTDAPSGAR